MSHDALNDRVSVCQHCAPGTSKLFNQRNKRCDEVVAEVQFQQCVVLFCNFRKSRIQNTLFYQSAALQATFPAEQPIRHVRCVTLGGFVREKDCRQTLISSSNAFLPTHHFSSRTSSTVFTVFFPCLNNSSTLCVTQGASLVGSMYVDVMVSTLW